MATNPAKLNTGHNCKPEWLIAYRVSSTFLSCLKHKAESTVTVLFMNNCRYLFLLNLLQYNICLGRTQTQSTSECLEFDSTVRIKSSVTL